MYLGFINISFTSYLKNWFSIIIRHIRNKFIISFSFKQWRVSIVLNFFGSLIKDGKEGKTHIYFEAFCLIEGALILWLIYIYIYIYIYIKVLLLFHLTENKFLNGLSKVSRMHGIIKFNHFFRCIIVVLLVISSLSSFTYYRVYIPLKVYNYNVSERVLE